MEKNPIYRAAAKGGVWWPASGGTRPPPGFTLIELMITVAIVGILATLAYSSYGSYLVRSSRAAAAAVLMDVAQREQQYLLDNRAYANWAALNVAVPGDVSKFYTIDAVPTAGPPPGFLATATPIPGGRQAADGALSINQAGTKLPAGKW